MAPRKVLIVDDEEVFRAVLARMLRRRGFDVHEAHDRATAIGTAAHCRPDACILDLKLGQDSGLRLITELLQELPDLRILVLTGYASIATAVEAIKLGAADYLAKPAEPDSIVARLTGIVVAADPAPIPAPPSVRRLEWEHIQRVLAECGGNVSEAARVLGMHRRTLQRKLSKRPVPR